MNFISAFTQPEEISKDSFWFLINEHDIIVHENNGSACIPDYTLVVKHGLNPENIQYMGTYNNVPCYVAEISDLKNLCPPFYHRPPLSLAGKTGEDFVRLAGLANHLADWNRNHIFCGRCGEPTVIKANERARICGKCGQIYYTKLSPAIIVAITRDDRILLARAQKFTAPFYSVPAGFVEPGESLEQCVRREVREEVGIEIKNIRYFGSQPWPFPDSLMIAFTADHAEGEIVVDKSELIEAAWYRADELPAIPSGISIARRLIDWFTGQNS